MKHENDDVIGVAKLGVEITSHRFLAKHADDAGFFPGFIESSFSGSMPGIDQSLGDDPAFAVAGGDETDFVVANRNGGGLSKKAGSSGHEISPQSM